MNARSGTDAIDLDRFSLRRFLASLGPDQVEVRTEPVELADIASILEANPRAVLFEKVGPEGAALAGNVAGSRARFARAFGTTEKDLLQEILRRLEQKAGIVEITRAEAPVQQVVVTGEEIDVTALPVHLQHELDGAPYISAAIDYVFDRDSSWTNVGARRMMLRGRRETGIDLASPSDLRAIYLAQVKRGEPLPIAFAVGSHPIDHVAATMRIPADELGLLASLRGAPLPVVKCVTSDIRVPADAEWVLEGYVDARGFVEQEGPYGEFLGYYGEVRRNPVFHLTAITRRRDALFQTVSIGGSNMAWTDSAQMIALRTEVTIWRALQTAVREVKAVYVPPATGGAFNVRIALNQRVPGEARNAISAAFASLANVKHVFVVDPDIDIFSDEQMEWAFATRFQAGRDMVLESGFRTIALDPSLAGLRTASKAGFDLTLPLLDAGHARPIQHRVSEPPKYAGRRFESMEAALRDGPKYFAQLMAATGSRDGREIVRELERLRAADRIERDGEGRYLLKP